MVDKGLRQTKTALHAAELVHLDMIVGVEIRRGVLTLVRQASLAFARLGCRDVNEMGRPEALCLGPQIDLEIRQGEVPAGPQPGIVHQQ